ncbi:MAG TPA: efflux RND transporter periplasmic adaptor subunit [Candidatus Angelobacter sp.]|nr:efflux RND transporter periplasmic adaptor subunit [Candidatus Angelobacter sp.]
MKVKKLLLLAGALVLVLAIVGFSVNQTQKNLVTVQTGKVARQDLASFVSASGEIKPKTYVNVGANAMGRILRLPVKEGDRVKAGDIVAQLENVQPAADVALQRSTLLSSETDTKAQEAALKTAMAVLNSSKADLVRTKQEYDRAESLYKNQLIAKADYDVKKSAYDVAVATVEQNDARVVQTKAQLDSSKEHEKQAQAQLTRSSDVLSKTVYRAPFDGVVTSLPVREGEMVVMGIQNSLGSTLMTIADLSVITAEVQVDETDIVNVKLRQSVDVTIDAIPGKVFKGEVTQIGDNAIIRSSGLATSQSTTGSQEAKDFKVTVTLTDPPQDLRPGLSATAKITTGTRNATLTIPIQALTIRDKADVEAANSKGGTAAPVAGTKARKEEIQGVFLVHPNRKIEFCKVETGLTGTTEIEVKSGVNENDEIITGSYKVLRTIRSGTSVKVDNSSGVKEAS